MHTLQKTKRYIQKGKESMKGQRKPLRLGNQEFDVGDSTLTFIPRNREARLKQLRKLVLHLLEERWQRIPQKVAVIEQRGVKELFDSLL